MTRKILSVKRLDSPAPHYTLPDEIDIVFADAFNSALLIIVPDWRESYFAVKKTDPSEHHVAVYFKGCCVLECQYECVQIHPEQGTTAANHMR